MTSLHIPSGTKLALVGGAKSLASPSEANTTSEVVLKSPVVQKRSLNATVLQPEQPSTRSSLVSIQDRLSLVNLDL